MRYLLLLSVLLMSACATTRTLNVKDCTTADWQAVGYQDGIRGASSQVILRHTQTCQGQATPNRQLWETGRQQGLAEYCTPANAYDLGRMGRTLTGVCEHNLDELHRANMMGLQQYEMSERINRLHYGYGGWGYLDPWFMPWWW